MTEPSAPSSSIDTRTMSPAGDGGPLSPGAVRWLKIAIVVMTIMIVLGILGVVARMFYLASTRPPQAARAAGSAVMGGIVPEAKVQLPPGAVIKSTVLDGGRMALTFDAPTGSGIVILDIASGRVLSRWRIEPEPPR